ncbi:MAG TPA: efflux transporter outer membrane subunit [Gammaproteobacteria bacterium]|nr:efflux transporter outer membrane subunit [Gammaproteobacteria bacterium]
MSRLILRFHFLVILVLLCEIMTACMLGPDFHRPKAPPVKNYTENHLPTKTASIRSPGTAGRAQYFSLGQNLPADWWYLFHSKALNQLIETGLASSPNLAAAQAALRQAKEALNAQIGTSLYPAVSAQFSASRQKFSDATLGFSNGGNPVFNLFNPSLNIAYTLDIFGANRRQIEALQAQVDYQAYQLQASYLTLTANIATIAITISSLKAQIQATQELIHSQAETLAIIKNQYHLGGSSGTAVLSQETLLAQTRATLPPLEQSLAQSLHVLAVLTGSFPSATVLPPIELDRLTLPSHLPLQLPSALTRQRPDIQAAEALLHAASAQIGVATANLFPQLTLNGGYGWESNTASALFRSHSVAWSLGGQLLQPIFYGGALRAKRREAIAAYEQAEAEYRQTVLQAFRNVADSLRALENDAEAFRAQKQAEIAAKNTLQLIKQQYHLGGVSYLSLLDAERQYQQTKIARIQSQASRYNDTIALFQALGGGWWSRSANGG